MLTKKALSPPKGRTRKSSVLETIALLAMEEPTLLSASDVQALGRAMLTKSAAIYRARGRALVVE